MYIEGALCYLAETVENVQQYSVGVCKIHTGDFSDNDSDRMRWFDLVADDCTILSAALGRGLLMGVGSTK